MLERDVSGVFIDHWLLCLLFKTSHWSVMILIIAVIIPSRYFTNYRVRKKEIYEKITWLTVIDWRKEAGHSASLEPEGPFSSMTADQCGTLLIPMYFLAFVFLSYTCFLLFFSDSLFFWPTASTTRVMSIAGRHVVLPLDWMKIGAGNSEGPWITVQDDGSPARQLEYILFYFSKTKDCRAPRGVQKFKLVDTCFGLKRIWMTVKDSFLVKKAGTWGFNTWQKKMNSSSLLRSFSSGVGLIYSSIVQT